MRAELVTAALLLAITLAGAALIKYAYGEDKQLCHMEPVAADWHYRTQIPPRPELKCWYDGPRMISRSKLYWAEVPAIAPTNVPNLIWQHEYRWTDPSGWTHQEGSEGR